jgi:hypothetical protein
MHLSTLLTCELLASGEHWTKGDRISLVDDIVIPREQFRHGLRDYRRDYHWVQ